IRASISPSISRMTPASCLEVVQRITGVMREIDGEIDALIGR
ncbi:hypothetical protein, partial [Klebsiella pneumoniae]